MSVLVTTAHVRRQHHWYLVLSHWMWIYVNFFRMNARNFLLMIETCEMLSDWSLCMWWILTNPRGIVLRILSWNQLLGNTMDCGKTIPPVLQDRKEHTEKNDVCDLNWQRYKNYGCRRRNNYKSLSTDFSLFKAQYCVEQIYRFISVYFILINIEY